MKKYRQTIFKLNHRLRKEVGKPGRGDRKRCVTIPTSAAARIIAQGTVSCLSLL